MTHAATRQCEYSTGRLVAGPWHRIALRYGIDIVEAVYTVLTSTTTATLPPAWQGDYDDERAGQWVQARDAESPTLLIVANDDSRAVGLLILFESAGRQATGLVDVRLGYVLAESEWGKGFARELVRGLVDWAMSEPSIGSISGGVARGNDASAHVLVSNGFVATDGAASAGETIYELVVRRDL